MSVNPFFQIFRKKLKENPEPLQRWLKQTAASINVTSRKDFENALLRAAQNVTDDGKRSIIYDVLASLKGLWELHRPQSKLQEAFWHHFRRGNFLEAEATYKTLARQGLDYSTTRSTAPGRLVPATTERQHILIQFHEQGLRVYSPRLEPKHDISLPSPFSIIDLIAPLTPEQLDYILPDSARKMWILAKDAEGRPQVLDTNMGFIHSDNSAQYLADKRRPPPKKAGKKAIGLSSFRDLLIVIFKQKIYYYKKERWVKWYTTTGEITAYTSTDEGFWIGHRDGGVTVLKYLTHKVLKATLDEFTRPVKGIRGSRRYVLVFDDNRLLIANHDGNPVAPPLEMGSDIADAAVLNEQILLVLHVNGMLTSRGIKQDSGIRRINLEGSYEFLFCFLHYVYCGKQDGQTVILEVPSSREMVNQLADRNIHMDNMALEPAPHAPVRNISAFIGRGGLLKEIETAQDAHFLLYGPPRTGKSSLLNVLRDALNTAGRCCLLDMRAMTEDEKKYPGFEAAFIGKCLEQHALERGALEHKSGHKALDDVITLVRGDRDYCFFCLDNFVIPDKAAPDNRDKYLSFFRYLFNHDATRIIMTCGTRGQNIVLRYLRDLEAHFGKMELLSKEIPLFTELEAKTALRRRIFPRQEMVDDIYTYTGKFPHLVNLYDQWDAFEQSPADNAAALAQKHHAYINAYFRDLSPTAYLLTAIFLRDDHIDEPVSFDVLEKRYPFLKHAFTREQIREAVTEINGYGLGISARHDDELLRISLEDTPGLFYLTAPFISLLKNFDPFFHFSAVPDWENAHKAAGAFAQITGGTLALAPELDRAASGSSKKCYVAQLSKLGLRSLKMPLATFIVIPRTPWRPGHQDAFRELAIQLQEHNRKEVEARQTGTLSNIYIILLDLLGDNTETIKDDLEGIPRASVIDAPGMKDILQAASPREKASEIIFHQLSIRERSPYMSTGAVPEELFFGRRTEVTLAQELPDNLGIFGSRTIGKTSLLKKLHALFRSHQGWKVIDMDCSRIQDETGLLTNLAEKMEVPFKDISSLARFRKYIARDAQAGGYRYLFLLDEVDRLVEYDRSVDENIFHTFNRLCTETLKTGGTAARFILFGFQEMFRQMKNPVSRLYNFMIFLPLRTLDWESAVDLVTKPVESIHLKWERRSDAEYLVEQCSRHPRLLQAACHALLANLDSGKAKRNTIHLKDVIEALASSSFREICMRFYHGPGEDNPGGKNSAPSPSEDVMMKDHHRITILAAINQLYTKNKKQFKITDIREELSDAGMEISPNALRHTLDHLCLCGVLRLKDEAVILAQKDTRSWERINKMKANRGLRARLGAPASMNPDNTAMSSFLYEFDVNIFPELLVKHFGGIDQCRLEQNNLIAKGEWRKWIKKY